MLDCHSVALPSLAFGNRSTHKLLDGFFLELIEMGAIEAD
jgi:hypothetical protein